MKVPDKIYISTNSQDGTYYISNQYKRLIEYIRTDAFVDKVVKFIEKIDNVDEYTWYNEEEHAVGITEKCIEDFKKYMENRL